MKISGGGPEYTEGGGKESISLPNYLPYLEQPQWSPILIRQERESTGLKLLYS